MMQPHEYVVMEVARERERQITAEGWSLEHDDAHDKGEMARAAACYLIAGEPTTEFKLAPIVVPANGRSAGDPDYEQVGHRIVPKLWPWWGQWWKPKTRRADLVRAAALVVAEIERLDRAAKAR